MNVAYLLRRLCLFLAFGMVLSTAWDAQAQQVPRPTKKGRKYKVRIDSAPQQAAIYLDDEKYGIVGYTLAKLLKGAPPLGQGDLTPFEKGLPVYQALTEQGWDAAELAAVFRQCLAMAKDAATGRHRLARKVQTHLDFSPPPVES